MDIDALAANERPLVASDAAEHASACSECRAAVEAEAALTRDLASIPGTPAPDDLPDRVLRLRRFTRRERTSLSLWGGPCLFALLVFAAGVTLLAPGLAPGEQASLLAAAALPVAAVLRAAARTLADLTTSAPEGLAVLSAALRGDWTLALASLALLLPAGLGLRRALAGARR
jgi:predicted anti-sigma-YlaC factor YlaD